MDIFLLMLRFLLIIIMSWRSSTIIVQVSDWMIGTAMFALVGNKTFNLIKEFTGE